MGAAARFEPICDAGGRFAAHPDAARSAVGRFLRDESGATAIEYALIALFLSILIVAGVTSIGTTVKGFFTSVTTAL
jgi:pilus assembly protein Flp/PilA